MINSVNLKDVEYVPGWAESKENLRWGGAFPFGAGSLQGLSVVHFYLEPGDALPRHTDSGEEMLVLLSGSVEAEIGGEKAVISAPSMTAVPSNVPHGFLNVGKERAYVIGIFPGAYSTATFEEVLYPFGLQVLRVPPLAPKEVPVGEAAAAGGKKVGK